ncbi:GntR family transcriptional regulator [Nocardia amamiensis]|nr:GntR family transcriptional regulator [Nocardia amamiensis]
MDVLLRPNISQVKDLDRTKKEGSRVPTPNPRWREIAADLRRRVDTGEWPPGETLPSMRELASHYAANSHATVNRAIMHLIGEGILITDPLAPRRGVRVRARPRLVRAIDAHFAGDGADRTFEASTGADDVDVQITYTRQAPTDVAEMLGNEPVLVRTFRYLIQGTPHQIMRSWMPESVANRAGLRSPDDEVPGKSTNTWLTEAGVQLKHVVLTIESRLPTEEEARDLAMPTALPVMVRNRTVYDTDLVAAETSTTIVVADQIVYRAEFDLN